MLNIHFDLEFFALLWDPRTSRMLAVAFQNVRVIFEGILFFFHLVNNSSCRHVLQSWFVCSQELFNFVSCHLRHVMFWWSKKMQKVTRKSLFQRERNKKIFDQSCHQNTLPFAKTIIRFNCAELLPSEYKSSHKYKYVSVLCVLHQNETNILLHRACSQRTSIQLSNLNNKFSKISLVLLTGSATVSTSILMHFSFCLIFRSYPNYKGYSSFNFNDIGTEQVQWIWETYSLL